jgi:hypothetical protein
VTLVLYKINKKATKLFCQIAIIFAFFRGIRAYQLIPSIYSNFLFFFFSMAESSSSTLAFSIPNIAHLCQFKLVDSNYLGWVFQFEPILKSHELMGIVDGSEPCPPKFILASDKTLPEILNPEYILWEKKDQCILIWFIATLTPQVIPIVYDCKTSAQVWTVLATPLCLTI